MSGDAQSRLNALRQRLRETSAQLAPAAQRVSGGPADPAAAQLRDVDHILSQTKALTAALARSEGPEWDECDELSGRLVLRELSLAVGGLRRVMQATGDELERTRSELRRIDDALPSIETKVGEAATYLEARHQDHLSDAPKKPRSR